MPAISILMPVYNAGNFLREAIDSILNQTFGNFELLIFNDGSTDNSKEIICSYTDSRIKSFHFEFHQGYVHLLNLGLNRAIGKYVARMDADDICHTERLKKQYEFLEQNPEYVICGTRFRLLGNQQIATLPIENDDIKLKMLYITPFCHPTVMLRLSILQKHQILYNTEHMPMEDHELWIRLSDLGKFYNLSEALLEYRVHDNNISLKKRSNKQILSFNNLRFDYIKNFFSSSIHSVNDATILYTLFFKESNFSYTELIQSGDLVRKIVNGRYKYSVPSQKVHDLLSYFFFYRCTTSTSIGIKAFIVANRYNFVKPRIISNFKLFVKSILKYKA